MSLTVIYVFFSAVKKQSRPCKAFVQLPLLLSIVFIAPLAMSDIFLHVFTKTTDGRVLSEIFIEKIFALIFLYL